MTEPTTSSPVTADGSARPLASERFRVVMADTDAARIIYYGAPLRWHERLSTAWLHDSGVPLSRMLRAGHGTPAVHVEVDYRVSLRLDDEVHATLWPYRVGRRAFTLESRYCRVPDPEPAVRVRVAMVYVSGVAGVGMKADVLPEGLAAQLRSARAG